MTLKQATDHAVIHASTNCTFSFEKYGDRHGIAQSFTPPVTTCKHDLRLHGGVTCLRHRWPSKNLSEMRAKWLINTALEKRKSCIISSLRKKFSRLRDENHFRVHGIGTVSPHGLNFSFTFLKYQYCAKAAPFHHKPKIKHLTLLHSLEGTNRALRLVAFAKRIGI